MCPRKQKKMPSKVAHNLPRPKVFIPAIVGFVELIQFYSLTFSHLWSCQTLQDEKISSGYLISNHLLICLHLVLGKILDLLYETPPKKDDAMLKFYCLRTLMPSNNPMQDQMTLYVSDKSTVWGYIKRLTSQDWPFLKPFITCVTPGNDRSAISLTYGL